MMAVNKRDGHEASGRKQRCAGPLIVGDCSG